MKGYIPIENLAILKEKVEKINKRVKKTGNGGFSLEISDDVSVGYCYPFIKKNEMGYPILDKEGKPKWGSRELPSVLVKVEGSVPKIDGYSFVASLSHKGNLNVVRTPSSEIEVPNEFFTSPGTRCDHCNIKRHRLESVVLKKDDTDEYIAVGKSCIKDFLGAYANVEEFAKMRSFMESIYEEFRSAGNEPSGFGCGRGRNVYTTREVVTASLVGIEHMGFYVSARDASEDKSTAGLASLLLNGPSPFLRGPSRDAERALYAALKAILEEKAEEFNAKFEDMVEWAENLEVGNNNYLNNIKALLTGTMIDSRDFGLTVSAPVAYDNSLKKEREAAAEKEKSNEYVGTVGKRENFTIEVKKALVWDSMYGSTYFYIMEDEAGNNIVWKASSNKLSESKSYVVKGTVKEHRVYKEKNQTVLTRVAVVEELSDEEE